MKLKASSVHSKELKSFISTFLRLGDACYMFIEDGKMKSKMYDPNKTLVMVDEIEIDKAIEFEAPLKKQLRIGLFDGVPNKFLKFLDLFDEDSLQFEVEVFESQSDDCLYGDSIHLRDGRLKMTVKCQDPKIGYIYLDDAKEEIVFDKKNASYSFNLSKEMIDRIMRLTAFDSGDRTLIQLYTDSEGVHLMKEDLFDLIVSEKVKAVNSPKHIFKHLLATVPSQNYEVFVFENKLLLYSLDNEFKMAINLARVEE